MYYHSYLKYLFTGLQQKVIHIILPIPSNLPTSPSPKMTHANKDYTHTSHAAYILYDLCGRYICSMQTAYVNQPTAVHTILAYIHTITPSFLCLPHHKVYKLCDLSIYCFFCCWQKVPNKTRALLENCKESAAPNEGIMVQIYSL